MSLSKIQTNKFLRRVIEKKYSEAERLLDKLNNQEKKDEWTKGYLSALSGILLAQKAQKDRYFFLRNINFEQKEELRKTHSEFSKYSDNKFHSDYDRGFFSAWTDCLSLLLKA